MRGTGKRRFLTALCVCALLALALGRASAAPQISFLREERFDSFVSMPLLIGMDNSFLQDSINKAIEEKGGFPFFLAALRALSDDGQTGIRAESQAVILGGPGGILSVRVDASGRVGPGRPGHSLTPMMFHLASGEAVTADEIFSDRAAAQEALEAFIDAQLAPEMSSYLDAHALLPLPMDRMLLDEAGISFLYEGEQLSLLSGWPASLHFSYGEAADLLDLGEGSVLRSAGAMEALTLCQHSKERIAALVAEGRLPGIPVALGQPMEEIRERYPLLADPDGFPGGTRIHPEDGRFRGVTLTSADGEEALGGIISARLAFAGLVTGRTERQEALDTLGEPLSSLALDERAAEPYGLEAGTLDSYVFGGNELLLSWDSGGRLSAVWIRPARS